jgi:urea carboxylase
MTLPEHARYTWGGDEFLVVEIAPDMSLEANFVSNSIAVGLEQRELPGIVDICPANASLLIRFDPDELAHTELERVVRELEVEVRRVAGGVLETRIIEVPVWYDDPYTRETGERFREGYHQDPSGTDLDYAAAVNGLADAQEFIRRHHERPWIVSMVGFVAGLPFLFQLAPRCPSTSARAPTPRRSPSATAAASPPTTRCAARAGTRCSASHRFPSTIRSRRSPTSPTSPCSSRPATS